MQDKFLKARIPRPLYDALQARAGEAGVRLGTHVREILERDAQVLSTTEALTRIEAALTASTSSAMPMRDHELHRDLQAWRELQPPSGREADATSWITGAARLSTTPPARWRSPGNRCTQPAGSAVRCRTARPSLGHGHHLSQDA